MDLAGEVIQAMTTFLKIEVTCKIVVIKAVRFSKNWCPKHVFVYAFLVFSKELQTTADFPIQMDDLNNILVKVGKDHSKLFSWSNLLTS
jgi:hypothetical protein